MGVRPHLHRRRLPGGLLADPPRREKGERGRLPQGDGRLLREPRRHDYPCDDRQWLLLSLEGLPLRLPRSRSQAHPDQAVYTPKTNGKAERFIQTALREWAYAQAYPTSDHRAAALPIWLAEAVP